MLNTDDDVDLLTALWNEAPFARLPADAPQELLNYVRDVENPKRVYAIYHASRRHGFQLLVEKFIIQLRYGCESKSCSTSTCFTYRKRAVGRAPIRRFNSTSARALAVYLASEDNPENGLCPNIRPPNAPPAAVHSLTFSANHTDPVCHTFAVKVPDGSFSTSPASSVAYVPRDRRPTVVGSPSTKGRPGSPPHAPAAAHITPPASARRGSRSSDTHRRPKSPLQSTRPGDGPRVRVTDRQVRKDMRSFTASLFGTVAFKMLEWLTPTGVDFIAKKVGEVEAEMRRDDVPTRSFPTAKAQEGSRDGQGDHINGYDFKSNQCKANQCKEDQSHHGQRNAGPSKEAGIRTDPTDRPGQELAVSAAPIVNAKAAVGSNLESSEAVEASGAAHGKSLERLPSAPNHLPHHPMKSSSGRNSNTKVRTSAGAKPKRTMSLEPFPAPVADDSKPALISPRGVILSPEKTHKAGRKNQRSCRVTTEPPITLDPGSVTQTPATDKEANRLPSRTGEADVSVADSGMPATRSGRVALVRETTPSPTSHLPSPNLVQAPDPSLGTLVPQSLSHLSIPVIDLLCDILSTDGTLEGSLFEATPSESLPELKALRPIGRRSRSSRAGHLSLRREWALFIHQSLFDVLSDPRALVRSFTTNQNLFDTHTLWYCMMRLARVTPGVMLDSLWIVAASLFAPPRCLRGPRSPTARVFVSSPTSLSNIDAGSVMSICLHGLVATVPIVGNAQTMREISEARSSGIALAQSGSQSLQSLRSVSMQYDDVFSNEMALRLARRLFAALATRRHFADLIECDDGLDETAADVDLLKPLFAQLENAEPAVVLEFPVSDRPAFDARMPTLLLDWAKAVMMRDWNGRPDFSTDGPFGGALSLMAAMYGNRKRLMLGELHFRLDYVADRLDKVQMPVAWLSFLATKQKQHLLDYPFIFSSDALVSFFRSINFYRMSVYFEEANTLPLRIEGIYDCETVLTSYHRAVIDDLLKTALCKFLVLNLRRASLLEDAFCQLWRREERELIRPLKVKLGEDNGEEGFDSGGVQIEFFRLAIAECLDPAFGAFTLDERTHMSWFVPGSMVEDWKFEMIGLLVSLAIHNGITLPVTFPRALYRRLLGRSVCELHHIADGWPDLASGLTTLLEWDEKDGLIEDVFARTYEFSISQLDETISHDMTRPLSAWPRAIQDTSTKHRAKGKEGATEETAGRRMEWSNATDAPLVTNANRNSYVTDYIRFLTDRSVARQFDAFERGFRTCLQARSLRLLSPSLLQSVVEGVQEIDVGEIRRHARYVGWDDHHTTVRDFWAVVRRYDDKMKRRLLEFVTASDRVPVGGIRNLQFILQRNGTEEGERGRLPTAYTCYGTLLLPEYRDREVLRERLGMALENARGFGFA